MYQTDIIWSKQSENTMHLLWASKGQKAATEKINAVMTPVPLSSSTYLLVSSMLLVALRIVSTMLLVALRIIPEQFKPGPVQFAIAKTKVTITAMRNRKRKKYDLN